MSKKQKQLTERELKYYIICYNVLLGLLFGVLADLYNIAWAVQLAYSDLVAFFINFFFAGFLMFMIIFCIYIDLKYLKGKFRTVEKNV